MLIQLKILKQRFINNGKVIKYSFYAIGEICLVVIGILIALQVNNLNLDRQYTQIELQYYQTMKDQLTKDRVILQDELYGIVERKEAYLIGKQIIKGNDRGRMDELGEKTIRLIEYGDFRRKSSVYQTLVYSGEIKYIKNKKIIEDLQEVERIYDITERLEEIQANLVMTHTAPAMLEILNLESGKIIFPELVFTQMFVNRFSVAIRVLDEKMAHFKDAVIVIDDAIKRIDSELNPKN